ncbi:hypothetical protein WMY93_014004 [Mugilogobius chulae]|uniref:Uncharacterized protein n=1 Tax=Mugilogobius chulae TaxID=88201 RepID=A0AAW0P5D7_9GOBI
MSQERGTVPSCDGSHRSWKSTLINGMINYILGVQWTDPYRFKLVVEEEKSQAHSQTSDGLETLEESTETEKPQNRSELSSPVTLGVMRYICVLCNSVCSPRLTATQQYVFDSPLHLGNDVAENIRVLITFADGELPPVLEAITELEFHVPKMMTESHLTISSTTLHCLL